MTGSAVGPTTASQPPPPPSASVQERLHAAWLQHAAASAGEGGAAGLDGCGSSQSERQLSSVGRGHTPDAGPTCRRSPGSEPTNLHSSSAGPCSCLPPQLAVQQNCTQSAAALGSCTLRAPAAACMPPPNRLDPPVAAAPSRPAAPEVQLDASDWELLELLRQEAEAAAAAAPPRGCAHIASARSPHSRRCTALQPPSQGQRRQQPTSPLARQLAALRSNAAQLQQQEGIASATGAEGQRLLSDAAVNAQPLAGSSGSSRAQPPASPQGEAGALLAQAVCLLVPQELLAEAEVAAAAASNAAQCVAAADKATASVNASDAVGPDGKRCSSGAVAMGAAAEQQAVLGRSMEHTGAPVHGPELAAASEALRRHCEEGRYDATRELLGQAGTAHAAALLEARDSLGRSALMLACAAGHGHLIKLLLRKGAGLDAQDAGGLTALHHAVLGGHRAVAQHLLKVGADATLRSRAGVSGAELIAAWAAQQQQEGQRELPMQQQEQQECSVPG